MADNTIDFELALVIHRLEAAGLKEGVDFNVIIDDSTHNDNDGPSD